MTIGEFRHLRIQEAGGVLRIEVVSPNVQGPDVAREFSAELRDAARRGATCPILVVLQNTTYLSSMGYAALFHVVKQAKQDGRGVRLCIAVEEVRKGAEIVGLPTVVGIHDREQAALEALAGDRAPAAASTSTAKPAP